MPLRKYLPAHEVVTAFDAGWATLRNGDLLTQAESNGFEVLVTTDKNLKYQQNIAARKIAIVVLGTTSWPRIEKAVNAVSEAMASLTDGDYVDVSIP